MSRLCRISIKQSSLILLLCWLATPCAGPCAAEDAATVAQGKSPNIVFLLVDDLGKHDLGCEGSTFYETPNIDRLASRAWRFEHAYSACQVCSPSRVALQTGRSPTRVPITDYINPDSGNQPHKWRRNTPLLPAPFELQLPLEEVTLAEALQPLGYTTFFAGKWHLGGAGYLPQDQGYDINVGGDEYGTPPGGYFSPYRNRRLPDGPAGEQLPLRLGRETASFIRQQAAQPDPFYAMLSFYSVHSPIQTTQPLWRKYRDKAEQLGLVADRPRFLFDRLQEVRQVQDNPLYAGMMESLDDAVGLVLEALEQSGQADNTIVVFTSDNGGVSSGDGYATSALPLRGGKGRQWEGGLRQPLMIHLPGQTEPERSDLPTVGTDLFPTLVELAGGSVAPQSLDGRSLAPVLHGEALEPLPLYWHYPHYGNQGGEPSSIVRDGKWKLIHYYEDDRDELYNLEEDVGEQRDVLALQSQVAGELQSKLRSWLREVDARFPTDNPNYDEQAAAEELLQAETVRMPRREVEHRAWYASDFVPNGGWWQER